MLKVRKLFDGGENGSLRWLGFVLACIYQKKEEEEEEKKATYDARSLIYCS